MKERMKVFGTDYDGTIINIEPQKAAAFGDLLNKHWEIDANEAANFWLKTGGLPRRFKFDYFYKNQFGKNLSAAEYKTIEAQYSHILKIEFYPKTKVLPGAIELLEFVHDHFNYCFVSSGVPMEEINYLVALNGLSDYFNLVLGTDNLYKSKRDHFKKILSEENPGLFIFIADGIEDMKIAKKFDITSIGVSTNHSQEELNKVGAIKTCADLYDALPIIRLFI
ncbi:MAG: HAD hydrolase-like protein [Candidatus Gottesmanbacteria bacterium]